MNFLPHLLSLLSDDGITINYTKHYVAQQFSCHTSVWKVISKFNLSDIYDIFVDIHGQSR